MADKPLEHMTLIAPLHETAGVILLSAVDRPDRRYGGYKVWLGLDEEQAKALEEECRAFFKQHPDTASKRRLKMKFLPAEPWDNEEDGFKGLRLLKTSKTTYAPAVFDAEGTPLFVPEDDRTGEGGVGSQRNIPRIGRGTTARVKISLGVSDVLDEDTKKPTGEKTPIARLRAVQIVDLVEFVPKREDQGFGAVGGGGFKAASVKGSGSSEGMPSVGNARGAEEDDDEEDDEPATPRTKNGKGGDATAF